jgi:3-isopropylmalate/(R)-2-methylmalate dehydratase small subunit
MLYTGKVWKFGDNIDTDVIFPSQYMLLPTIEEMKVHTFEPLVNDFHRKVTPGDIVVGGENFGGGSSREQAPAVLKAVGITCIIAKSFARIFYRNALNIGLLAIVCDCVDQVCQGEELTVDLELQRVKTGGKSFGFKPFPAHVAGMVAAGGLIEFINGSGR